MSLQRVNSVLLHDTFMIDDVRINSHSSFDFIFFLLLTFGVYTHKGIFGKNNN